MSRTHFVSDKYRVKMLLTHLPGQNGHHFRWRHFQMHFHEWKILHFGLNSFRGSIDKNQHWFRWWLGAEQATSHYITNAEAINWTNAGPVHWRKYAALGGGGGG